MVTTKIYIYPIWMANKYFKDIIDYFDEDDVIMGDLHEEEWLFSGEKEQFFPEETFWYLHNTKYTVSWTDRK